MDFVWPAPHCSEGKKASHLAKISSVVTIVLKEAELNRGLMYSIIRAALTGCWGEDRIPPAPSPNS